ncbi:MAG: 4-hydroxy-tetrahydrodipicolinate synthase [Firmicutes bacterium]|nr:4-hydroxy-tetrahydrodipicolinate synthase [Bacillota bacterium]
MAIFKGSGVAIVTPHKNGKVDYESMGNLVEWHIAEGTDAIIVCGTTGEASTLTTEEQIETIRFVADKVAKRIPVIAGTGSNNTAHAIELSVEAEKTGVDGLLCVTPYYNKATAKGLQRHYFAIADSVNIPIVLYSVPSRTGLNITPAMAAELKKHPNIQAIKEASGNISQIVEMAKIVDDDFDMYSGNDDHVVPVLSVGGSGVISTVANIDPKNNHLMCQKFFDGDLKGALEIQLAQKHLIDAVFSEVNPIPIKAAVWLMGKCELEYRLPLCEPEDATIERLKKEMREYGIL